ncbi:uncharacterized protein BX664DRAFT_68541 [Halteromyces radiatus]|uniref:uncharacterized protein n=1 Tax=Halteromyces radiatus TaxID=101107 RepID=UPI002220370A|nr:uncharacterized protein BX664DRAFT_68541 [Halteromyces radiatus]KAI8096895.1 hypothetical protein BX664DRAFT_68541 [Halteromyces radiatus]
MSMIVINDPRVVVATSNGISSSSYHININLETANWTQLISALLEQYKKLNHKKNVQSKRYVDIDDDGKDNTIQFVNQVVQIYIDDPMEQDVSGKNESGFVNENDTLDTSKVQDQANRTAKLPSLVRSLPNGTTTMDLNPPSSDIPVLNNTQTDDKANENNKEHTMESSLPATLDRNLNMTVTRRDDHGTLQHFFGKAATCVEITDLTADDDDDISTADGYGNRSLKRKRDDQTNNAGNDDDKDDDDEREEKRSSLRASKRQKEKVESEEVSKKKMLEEENALNSMVQDVFDTLGNLNGLCRSTPWFAPMTIGIDTSMLEHFWSFFDYKVSELGTTFTWNFGNWKVKDDLNSILPNGKYRFAKFESDSSLLPTSSSNNDDLTVRKFIDSLNHINSGTLDCLCLTIIAILQQITNSTDNVDEATMDLLLEATELMGQDLINTLSSNRDLCPQLETNEQQLQVILCLSENLTDRLINSIRTEQANTVTGTSLSSKQRMLTEKHAKMTKHHKELCNLWMTIVDRTLIKDSMDSFEPSFLTQTKSKDMMMTNNRKKLLSRYWWLKGKLAQCDNNVVDAIQWYQKCELLFEMNDEGELDSRLHCQYDSILNGSSIKRKLRLLQIGKYLVEVQSKMVDHDYEGALLKLEPIVQKDWDSSESTATDVGTPVMTLLAKCYLETNRYLDAWKCYVKILTALISELVSYGGDRMMKGTLLKKGDDTEFFRLLSSIDQVIDAFIHLLLDTESDKWLPHNLDAGFIDSLMILLRTTIIYTFRHPDFIPLVNNFSNPEMTPHVPSRKTKINSYNAVTTKSWVLVSTLAQQKIKYDNDENKMVSLASLLQNMHDELGEREVCGASKGIFLQHLVQVLSEVDANNNRRGIYQCYHCLYGVHLAAEAELIEEHHAVHGTLNEEAAEHLYNLVIDDVLMKMDRNAPLKNDLRDAIETVSGLFEELPSDNSYVQRNRAIIEGYLGRLVNIHQSIQSMLQQSDLPIDLTEAKSSSSSSLSVVFGHIFFIRGKILRMHIKNRPKVSSEKTMTDLEEAIEQFKCHVILHPDDHQGWYELGCSLSQLAEEELTWSAVNIITHQDQIIIYQREAFHCFIKTWQLSTVGHRLKKKQLFEFFTRFGSLVYSMACAPMNMEAFIWNKPVKTLDSTGTLQDTKPIKPKPSLAYRLSLELFSQALHYKSEDHSEWRTLFMIGKCYGNLHRPAKEVIGWYMRSIKQSHDTSSTGNAPLEPIYKLYSTLAKYLYTGSIKVSLDLSDL